MKSIPNLLSILLIILVVTACNQHTKEETVIVPAQASDFLGQWTLTIDGGWVGWLEVRQEEAYLDADLLWKWASVSPVANIHLQGDKLIVTRVGSLVRTKDDSGKAIREQIPTYTLEVSRDGANIKGYFLEPKANGLGVDSTAFTGILLPDVPAAPDLTNLKWGKSITLFNGTDLTGWKLTNKDQVNGFSVIDGVLVNDPVQPENGVHINYGNLQTEQEFEDFNLKLEVNVPPHSNSGVYLRGIYEVQVIDSYSQPLDAHNMGGIYSRITPSVNAEKPGGEWQTMNITLCDRHVSVILNGVMIIDNEPLYGPTGGAMHADVFIPGPLYLQGDHGKVAYRNIVLTPILKD
ncbi:MAG: DUF1080 domain-containing protein [Prolixibacteraceae bacterium]